jgi:P-type conjugative transfer protein TrbG
VNTPRPMFDARARVALCALQTALLGACSTTGAARSTTFVRATPAAEVISTPEAPTTAEPARRAPPKPPTEALPKAGSPSEVVEAANRRAAQSPDEEGYSNAVMTYDYEPGALFQVFSAPLRLTVLQLQPGEQIVGQPAGGDTTRWKVALGRSAENGVPVQHIYIRPVRPGLHTTMAINTDRRTYLLELHSYADTYMAAVRWNYSDDASTLELATVGASPKSPQVNLEDVNLSYRVQVLKGHPTWVPVQVFDDGRKTFIRFPESMLRREAPALFVLTRAARNADSQLVNYRVRGEWYVVDRLFEAAELRLGERSQDVVRITKLDEVANGNR